MSFVEHMIDDGFHDEQEYLDYICMKAEELYDERCEYNKYFDGEEYYDNEDEDEDEEWE